MRNRRPTQAMQDWTERCERYDAEVRRFLVRGGMAALALATPIALLEGDVAGGYAAVFCIGVVFYFIVLRLVLAAMLMCPRCNEPPAPVNQYSHPRRAESCEHCGCELVARSRR